MHEPKPDPQFSRRPLGLTLIGYTYAVLFGLQGLVGAMRLLFSSAAQQEIQDAFTKLGLQFKHLQIHTIMQGLIVSQILFSLLYLVMGIGLLKRREWARQTLIYFIIIAALFALLISLVHAQFAFYMVVFLLYPAVVFWYLTKSEIKAWFQGK